MSVEMLSSPISEPAPVQPRTAKGDEIDLGAIVAAIKRRRWTILGLAVLCTSMGIGASYAVKPSYWAEAVISLNVRSSAVTDTVNVVPDLKVDGSIIRGEIDIITPRTAAGGVVDTLVLKPEPVPDDPGAVKGGLQRLGRSIVESGLFDSVASLIGPNDPVAPLRQPLAAPAAPMAPVVNDP